MRLCRSAMLFAAALGAAAVAQESGPAAAPYGYDCATDAQGPFGQISAMRNIADGGSGYGYHMQWRTPWRDRGVRLEIRWTRRDVAPPQDMDIVQIYVPTGRRGSHVRRMELRRDAATSATRELAFSTQFERESGDAFASARWSELRALMQGLEALHVRVIERSRGVVARDRIEAAWLAWPEAAVAAVRGPIEAMVADYRNRCPAHVYSPGEDI